MGVAESGGEEQATGAASGNPDVFLSYASQDAAVANTVVAALESQGIRCWIAPRDVTPGEFYAGAIVHAIDAAKATVLILSGNAAASPHVVREVERAASKRHPVISLRLDQAPLPADLEYFLNTSQWLDASGGDTNRAIPKLVDAVRAAIEKNATPGVSALTTAAGKSSRASYPADNIRSRYKVAVAAGSLVAVSIAGLVAYRLWLPEHQVVSPAPAVATGTPAAVTAAPVIPEKSVAVLPFVDMSEQKDQEYFSDGMSEELIDMLTKIPDLKVPARTSSFYFKGKQATITEIAKALGVAHVLEGSVRKSGKTLRVTAQLIRMDNGYHMWSQTYDRNVKDIFKVQDEIATAVVEALKAQLLPVQQAAHAHRTANTEAYNEYLLGRQFYNQRSDEGFRRALIAYRKAIALDPGFASAYAGLAMSEALLADSNSDAVSVQQAEAHAESAVMLAPDLADSYAARGFVRYYRGWDWSGAEADFNKALALDPSDSTVQVRYGGLLVALGRLEGAIAATKKATVLDPLSTLAWHRLSRYYIATRQFAAAHDAIRRALEIQPEYPAAQSALGTLLLLEGKAAEALVTVRQISSESSRLSGIAIAEHTLGHNEESQRALDELIEKHSRDSAFLIAQTNAWRGDKDQAFAWLERAYERHDSQFFNLKSEPRFASLLGDPRYHALLRKLNLPD
jgi:TolB-like protein/Tfp pilus assembly protein PilF